MLDIVIPAFEQYDEATNTFLTSKEQKLTLEHSLVSISKWESKWKKPFISRDKKTVEETIDYIRCMTITKNVNPDAYYGIPIELIQKINEYIDDPMTATWINSREPKRYSRQIITSELIYYWMVSYRIPIECQKWHLNRLLMLIQVCDEKNKPEKKMTQRQIMSRNAALNAARKAKLHTKG